MRHFVGRSVGRLFLLFIVFFSVPFLHGVVMSQSFQEGAKNEEEREQCVPLNDEMIKEIGYSHQEGAKNEEEQEQWVTLNDEMIKEIGYSHKSRVIRLARASLKKSDFRITQLSVKGTGHGGRRHKKQINMTQSAYEFLVSKAKMHHFMKEHKKTGQHFLYIIHNPVFVHYGPNVYKVGYSTDVERRVTDRSAFLLEECTVLYKKQVSSMKDERKLHEILNNYRMRQNREFFDCPLDVIKEAMDSIV